MFNIFTAALEVVLGPFSKYGVILRQLWHLEEDEVGVDRRTDTPLMRAPEKQRKQWEALPPSPPRVVIQTAGQKYAQVREFR